MTALELTRECIRRGWLTKGGAVSIAKLPLTAPEREDLAARMEIPHVRAAVKSGSVVLSRANLSTHMHRPIDMDERREIEALFGYRIGSEWGPAVRRALLWHARQVVAQSKAVAA